MANDNEFSFGNIGNNNSERDYNTDYLDLLSETEVEAQDEADSSREIYSDSSKAQNIRSFVNNPYVEDVYSNSEDEPDDVFTITEEPKEYEDIYSNSDISLSKLRASRRAEQEYEDIPITQRTARTAPTAIRNPRMDLDEDEVSDYEMRRGKLVGEKKKKKRKTPKILVVLAIFLAVVVAFGGVLLSAASGVVDNFTKGEEIEHISDVSSLASSSDVTNILFIGADKERGGASRSDSIMIVSVNKSAGKVIVTSILRDTHVDIPGECEAKINSAYAWGGANLLIQTIEQNFNIKIDGYAVVNFNMFTELVDGLGGIDIEVTENEADYINNRHNYKGEKKPDEFQSGESVHLNGYQALWYARIRKLDSDFMRTYRQRKVIAAIAENVKTELVTGNVFGLISTAKDVAPNIETSLSKSEFTSLILSMVSCVSKSGLEMDKLLVSQQLPFEDTWWYESKWDGSSIAIDLSENREMLYNSIYEPVIEEETEEATTNE
ncbi:MAG: LytR family transcriptional regulator [Ruminococcaceae bacterium]|nr:LytR family transcriptional regulator [Oscillospiraceae bacterium]